MVGGFCELVAVSRDASSYRHLPPQSASGKEDGVARVLLLLLRHGSFQSEVGRLEASCYH